MTTSKEQQPSIPEESYSDEDKKLIVSLLKEYSEKLLRICYQIDKQKKRLLLFYFGGLINLLFLTKLISYLDSNKLALTRNISDIEILISLYMAATFFGTFYGFMQNRKQNRKLISDAKILAIRLKKVIRIASQIQEHVLSNFVSQLELDLRLADAESTLQHYTDLLKTTKRLFEFFDK